MLAFIGVTILMVLNLVIYHKVFGVIYFDLGKGILKEIVGAYIVAILELGIVKFLGKSLLGGALSVAGWILNVIIWILKLVLIIGIAAAIIYAVYWLINLIRGKKEKNTTDGSETQAGEAVQKVSMGNSEKVQRKVKYCVYCGKQIAENSAFCTFCGKEKWEKK